MKQPTNYDAFQVLLLQLQDEGRGEMLLGESAHRARHVAEPFLIGEKLPGIYLELPLIGDPFLDMTILYGDEATPNSHVESAATGDTKALFDWFVKTRHDFEDVSFGFELDTKEPELPKAAIHFQPRKHIELVEPFCKLIGEPDRAKTYLDMVKRMPEEWQLSFFGMFRGRPDSPLRVCGYLTSDERVKCAEDPAHLAEVFSEVGFTAYDDALLNETCELMAIAHKGLDFQFDVYPDGHLSDTFAFDVQFGIDQPESVRNCFQSGTASDVVELLERWGIADKRWKSAVDATFARALPVELDDGTAGRYAFTLMPQWLKVRWRAGTLQPAKLYFLANAGLTEDKDD